MKRFYSLLLLVLLVGLTLTAGVREDFKANPLLSANNYQAYPASGFPALTAAPAGYEPFFINHYGRHGSRWLIREKSYTLPIDMLEKGERDGKLTRRGAEVLAILRDLRASAQGRDGRAERHRCRAAPAHRAPHVPEFPAGVPGRCPREGTLDGGHPLHPVDAERGGHAGLAQPAPAHHHRCQRGRPCTTWTTATAWSSPCVPPCTTSSRMWTCMTCSVPTTSTTCGATTTHSGTSARVKHRWRSAAWTTWRPTCCATSSRMPTRPSPTTTGTRSVAALWPRERGAAAGVPDGHQRRRLPHDRPRDAG